MPYQSCSSNFVTPDEVHEPAVHNDEGCALQYRQAALLAILQGGHVSAAAKRCLEAELQFCCSCMLTRNECAEKTVDNFIVAA